ncbi:MAG: hypothetical protein APF76_07725 [Desulfitibacter sp. BRH_c19]|nr:MAG: hypothetical protein APF76_07725 [Desulfitibacter sp. BRH_c19]
MIGILVFSTIVTFVLILYEVIFANKIAITERLQEIKKIGRELEDDNDLRKPFIERIIKPAYCKLGNILGSLAPKEIKHKVEKKIIYAGNPWNLTFNSFLTMQVVLGVLLSSIFLVIFKLVDIQSDRLFLILIVMFLFGFFLPSVVLSSKVANRQMEIQNSLPDMLDLLLVTVEAGLGFDMALKRVADKMPGELSKELNRALDEMRRGRTREEALRGITKRTGVADLSTFISAIIQAEQLGSNIANTLRIQAVSMRHKRRQRAEEKAMKAPIKMLFPLIFFIFPTLFVVLLGPAAIRIMQAFETMF